MILFITTAVETSNPTKEISGGRNYAWQLRLQEK
jgi:hypothetical protein